MSSTQRVCASIAANDELHATADYGRPCFLQDMAAAAALVLDSTDGRGWLSLQLIEPGVGMVGMDGVQEIVAAPFMKGTDRGLGASRKCSIAATFGCKKG